MALGVGDFEHHWFVEIDLGTETMLRRIEKCRQYEAYYRSGVEQALCDIFPKVVWCLPNQKLADDLRIRIARARSITSDIFTITTRHELLTTLSGGPS